MVVSKAIEIAKPFVIKKPVLQYALVTPQYVIATDGYRLIRIRHGEAVQAAYLYDYKQKAKLDEADSYPQTDRLFPDVNDAQAHFTIDVKEWLKIHELAHIAAKPLKDKVTELHVKTPEISFKHRLDNNTSIQLRIHA